MAAYYKVTGLHGHSLTGELPTAKVALLAALKIAKTYMNELSVVPYTAEGSIDRDEPVMGIMSPAGKYNDYWPAKLGIKR